MTLPFTLTTNGEVLLVTTVNTNLPSTITIFSAVMLIPATFLSTTLNTALVLLVALYL